MTLVVHSAAGLLQLAVAAAAASRGRLLSRLVLAAAAGHMRHERRPCDLQHIKKAAAGGAVHESHITHSDKGSSNGAHISKQGTTVCISHAIQHVQQGNQAMASKGRAGY